MTDLKMNSNRNSVTEPEKIPDLCGTTFDRNLQLKQAKS